MPRIDDIRLRRGDLAAWTAANPTLNDGEVGLIIDHKSFVVGDGASQFSSLRPWLDGRVLGASSLTELTATYTSSSTSWANVLTASTANLEPGEVLLLHVEGQFYASLPAGGSALIKLIVGATEYGVRGVYTQTAGDKTEHFYKTIAFTSLTGVNAVTIKVRLTTSGGYVAINPASYLYHYAQIRQDVWRL